MERDMFEEAFVLPDPARVAPGAVLAAPENRETGAVGLSGGDGEMKMKRCARREFGNEGPAPQSQNSQNFETSPRSIFGKMKRWA